MLRRIRNALLNAPARMPESKKWLKPCRKSDDGAVLCAWADLMGDLQVRIIRKHENEEEFRAKFAFAYHEHSVDHPQYAKTRFTTISGIQYPASKKAELEWDGRTDRKIVIAETKFFYARTS